MKSVYDVIISPIITEKSASLAENELIYTFQVAKDANKIEIKNAIETIYSVKVKAVRTIVVQRKAKRLNRYQGFKAGYKKAYVRLEKGFKIDSFEV